jgi:hypothetical protein
VVNQLSSNPQWQLLSDRTLLLKYLKYHQKRAPAIKEESKKKFKQAVQFGYSATQREALHQEGESLKVVLSI